MIRELAWEDADEARELWRRCFGALKDDDEPERLRRAFDRNPGLFLVDEIDGRIAGTTLATTDGRRGFLYHVATHPSYRRRGIAGALVREACRRLFERGVTTIHLRVAAENAAAIALYESLGLTRDPPVMGMRMVRRAP